MLKKNLGLIDVFCIASGAMISSGLFVLPGIAFAKAGPAIILSYALAALLVVPTMLAKAELATAMPKTGGDYFFVERGLGPLMGTVAGLLSWLSLSLKAAFALVGIGALGVMIFPELEVGGIEIGIKFIAILGCFFFAALNIVSVKATSRLQVFLVFGLIAIIAAYSVAGLDAVDSVKFAPFMPFGWQSVFAVTGMVFVSFGGLTKVAAVAEEVQNPSRNLPMGMFLSFGVVTALYILVVLVTVGVVDGELLSGSLAPISLGAEFFMGEIGVILIGFAGFLAFSSTANAGLLSASRSPMAMSKDGFAPEFLSKTNKRFGTPHIAVAATALFMALVIGLLSVEDLVKTASTMMILLFGLVNLVVIVMRHSGIESYRPTFRPHWAPWVQIPVTVLYAFLIFEMGRLPLILTGGFILAAILWYLGYVQRRIDRQSGFVYLVRRISSKAIQRGNLEDELRKIAIERDGVEFDRFDELVHDCVILDIEERISAKAFFRRVAAALAPRLHASEEDLVRLFLARERESTTVIEEGLAIPHVVVEGENLFDIVLVRCKEGVVFSELLEPVTTAFVLIGSADERNYHLRALMTIAHLVQEAEFKKRWLLAQGVEQLRDIVLLSARKREKQL